MANNTTIEGSPQSLSTNNEEESPQEWKDKEAKLLSKLAEYEKAIAIEKQVIASLQKDLQTRTEERDNYKTQVANLEKELKESIQKTLKKQGMKSEEMVTNATSVIFEKTKVCKNQELQIQALNQQNSSLKEIVGITKDLLDIRNLEIEHLQERLGCMEKKFSAEKEGQSLMKTKLDRMVQLNVALKQEYEKQLELFNQLRRSYTERQDAIDRRDTLATELEEEKSPAIQPPEAPTQEIPAAPETQTTETPAVPEAKTPAAPEAETPETSAAPEAETAETSAAPEAETPNEDHENNTSTAE